MLKQSLISEGVFQVTGADGAMACLSLPQVLARLSAGEDLGFDALRPHQRPAWHAFLVQLAYLALEGGEEPEPPTSAEAWCVKLRALTPGHDDDAPWCLVNVDWQRPAFMQPHLQCGADGGLQTHGRFGARHRRASYPGCRANCRLPTIAPTSTPQVPHASACFRLQGL